MYPTAKIAVERTTYAFDKLYTYLLPAELVETVQPGVRVKVPFGGGNRSRTGIVLAIDASPTREKLKPIARQLDPQPLLNSEGLELLHYLREHTFCTWFDALRLLLPAGLEILHKTVYRLGTPAAETSWTPQQAEILAWVKKHRNGAKSEPLYAEFSIDADDPALLELLQSGALTRREQSSRRLQDSKVSMVRFLPADPLPKLTPKQTLVAAFLQETQTASLKEVCYFTGVTRAVVDNLKKRGLVEYYDAVRYRSPFAETVVAALDTPTLTPQQQTAFDTLSALTRQERPAPALLFGVTGSGKTAVFFKLMEQMVEQGKSVLVLVPEISLTVQAVEAFRSRFGKAVAVLHSGLSLGERMDEWRRIHAGTATVVVGTRSAVFAPLQNIGLIVIDEEQEHTYHSEQSPRFHARDVALRRSAHHGALLVLASATPSIETYYHAKKGRYHLVSLTERYRGAHLPDIHIVDLREAENLSNSPTISLPLLEALQYNLQQREQSILLLNRRGYSTLVKCSHCGQVAECPHCSVAMTYHSANNHLICHYCGHIRERAESCQHCGSDLIRYAGIGTQKLEQELAALLPDARILRVDADTTMAKFSHEKLFASFAAHEYDIMVGTQMVAKGLNFPNVTLVGVMSADQSLYGGDFRSFERSFSLLTQVVGRGGRGEKRGRAFVQTYAPDHPVIELAATQDYPAFYTQEIMSRQLHLYPPFCTLAGIGFVGTVQKEVQHWAAAFLQQFSRVAAEHYPALPIRALGPAPADVLKGAGKYRYKIILKCRNSSDTRALLQRMLQWFYKQCRTVTIFIDMHYDQM